MRIQIEYVAPPIPSRNHDWRAYDADSFDGELRDGEWVGGKQGWGASPQEALDDLKAQQEGK